MDTTAQDAKLYASFKKSEEQHSYCRGCPHAHVFEVFEDVSRYGDVYASHPNYCGGKLVTTDSESDDSSPRCKGCFRDHLQERIEMGEICLRCHRPLTAKTRAPSVETRDVETKRLESRVSLCDKCFGQRLGAAIKAKGKAKRDRPAPPAGMGGIR